jgi:hypothetical protein
MTPRPITPPLRFASPYRDDAEVSPKAERFAMERLPGPFGRTRALTGRAGRRVLFLALLIVCMLCLWHVQPVGAPTTPLTPGQAHRAKIRAQT